MGKRKTKAIQLTIQAYSRIFRHIQVYSGIIQAYSAIFRTLRNLQIFRTLVYSEPQHIQIQKHIQKQRPGIFNNLAVSVPEAYSEVMFSTRSIFRNLVYLEFQHIQNSRHIQNPVKYLRQSVFRKQFTAIIAFAISAFHVLSFMK